MLDNGIDWDYGKLTRNRVEIEFPCGRWQNGGSSPVLPGLPCKLCADGTKGVTELALRADLETGWYTFSFTHGLVHEPDNFSGQFWIVYFDRREVGCGGIAPVHLAPEVVAEQDTQEVRFLCSGAGRHLVTLLVTNVDVFADDAFDLLDVSLSRAEAPAPSHSLQSEHPGRCFIDVWGWMNCLSYQRAIATPPPPGDAYNEADRPVEWQNYFVADPAYMRRNVIEESFRWGANGQECYVNDNYGGITHWPMSWSKDDPIPGAETYNHFAPPYLQDEQLRHLARFAHLHDSLFHWYGHIPERDAYSWHRNYVGPDRTSKEWLYNLQSKIARDFADVIADREAAIDGWAAEYMELMDQSESADEIAELTRRMWRHNPGAYLSDNVVNTWSRYRSCATPAFSHTLLSQSRDDGAPLDLYGDTFRHGRFGKTYFNLQGDARPRSPNVFGGWIDPDFIVKQCNDFFRQRALEPDDIHSSCVWWMNENRFTTPGVVRRYIYAASQDPMKVAAAFFLSTLGKGGKLEKMGKRRPYRHTGTANPFFRRRSELPPDTAVIQNNHMSLSLPADAQGGLLLLDVEGLAHFDGHGANVCLSPALFETVFKGGVERVWTVTDFPEPAGYRSVLRQRLRLLGGAGRKAASEGTGAGCTGDSGVGVRFSQTPGRGAGAGGIVAGAAGGQVPGCQDGRTAAAAGGAGAAGAQVAEAVAGDEGAAGREAQEMSEERTFTIHNDTPYVKLNVKRTGSGRWQSRIAVPHHDCLRVGGGEFRQAAEFPICGASSFVFSDSNGLLPSWALVVLSAGRADALRWNPGEGVVLVTRSNGGAEGGARSGDAADDPRGGPGCGTGPDGAWAPDTCRGAANRDDGSQSPGECQAVVDGAEELQEFAFVALGSLYREEDLGQVETALGRDRVEGVALADGMELSNELDIPRVVVAQLNDPAGTPYLVQENGWWMFRGAQPALDDNCDFLKVYLSPRGKARILRYGFIDGIVKPGWGCQYQLALGEVSRDGAADETGSSCLVRVFSVTPNLFAPRVEFARSIADATVDGKPRQYHDGRFLFLPNRPGTYRVQVNHGDCLAPRLIRTFALVESCAWQDDSLVFRAALPPWCNELHPKLLFTAAILTCGRPIVRLDGANIVRHEGEGTIVEFGPGEVAIRFGESMVREDPGESLVIRPAGHLEKGPSVVL